MSENDDLSPACNVGVRNVQRIHTLEKESEKQWSAIDKLRNRPPVWVTFVIAGLSAITGSALTFAGIMSRISNSPKTTEVLHGIVGSFWS